MRTYGIVAGAGRSTIIRVFSNGKLMHLSRLEWRLLFVSRLLHYVAFVSSRTAFFVLHNNRSVN